MKRKTLIVLGIIALMAMPLMAKADNFAPPEWAFQGLYGHAEWTPEGVVLGGPEIYANVFDSFGGTLDTPYISGFPTGTGYPFIGDYAGQSTIVFDFPTFNVFFDNFDIPNPYKKIRVQLTYATPFGYDVILNSFPGGTVTPVAVTATPPAGFTHAAWDILIAGNPDWELINFCHTVGTCDFYVKQLVIDTQCVPVPGTLVLLGTGLSGLVIMWRRRQS